MTEEYLSNLVNGKNERKVIHGNESFEEPHVTLVTKNRNNIENCMDNKRT